jgi:hypothetical protein
MKIIQLSNEEAARHNYTHKAILSVAPDGTAYPLGDFTAAATTQTYTLMTLFAGHVVTAAAYKVVTFVLGGAISAVTLQVGFTGTTNGFIAATSVFTGGTAFVGGGGASFAGSGRTFTAASALVAVLTTTTANVSVVTAGEIHIYWSIADLNKV